ncbi:MAG: hotdog fold thioesterase [Sphingomonadales bacterium]|jgi:1,4-dihydroxy-2-naphthoyl-CoA hydrolase
MSGSRIWQRTALDPAALTGGEANSLAAHLGIVITEIGDDFIAATMPVDARTMQPHGRLHGGASVALAETVGSLAANLTLDPAQQIAVGLDINANHVRPVKQGLVIATARPEALGRTTQVWSIRIVDEQDRLVCISRLTMAIIPVERT